jgi:fido (protein-threonine AMPylation protein)
MIDSTDFTIPGTGILRNKLGITDPVTLLKATADSTALRLAELHATPLRGGFDSAHLEALHGHLFQDIYDWAGELRRSDVGNLPASEMEASLNVVLDRLRRENYLKGCRPEEWAQSASAYVYDLGTIQPFLAGNDVALRAFADELARKNNLDLQWQTPPEIAVTEVMTHLQQSGKSAYLRRILMLAVDSQPNPIRPNRIHLMERGIERFLPIGNSLL